MRPNMLRRDCGDKEVTMNMPANTQLSSGIEGHHREDPAERARRIAELKRQVQSGTYLIQRYEIIEGILDSLSTDND